MSWWFASRICSYGINMTLLIGIEIRILKIIVFVYISNSVSQNIESRMIS